MRAERKRKRATEEGLVAHGLENPVRYGEDGLVSVSRHDASIREQARGMRWRPRYDGDEDDDDDDGSDDALGPSNMEVESRGSRVVAPVVLVPGPAAPSSAT